MRAGPVVAVAVVAALSSGCGSSGPPKEVRRGAQVFAYSGCLDCHTYAGVGLEKLGAPDLTREKRRDRGDGWQARHLKSPRAVVPGSKMPAAPLKKDEVDALVAFLEKSDGQWQATDFWYGSGV